MTVSVESVATSAGTGRGSSTALTHSSRNAAGPSTAVTSRRRSVPRRSKPNTASALVHTATQEVHPYNFGYASPRRHIATPAPRDHGFVHARVQTGAARAAPSTGCGDDGDGLRATQERRAVGGPPPGDRGATPVGAVRSDRRGSTPRSRSGLC